MLITHGSDAVGIFMPKGGMPMAIPAIPTALKTAAAVLSNEKGRTAVLTIVVSSLLLVLLPFILLLTILTMPFGQLAGLFLGEDYEEILAFRTEYGFDQYIDDESYILYTDLSGVVFEDGATPVVYYNQLDERWADLAYGDSTIGRAGCGPTALAMVVSSLTEHRISPVGLSGWAYENGYKCVGNGSYLRLIPDGATHYGLTVEGCSGADPQQIVDTLSSGGLVIALMGPGTFTKSGHFIVLRGVTEEGNILIADPASASRSQKEWPLSQIIRESRTGAGAGGPFWCIKS